MALKSTISLSFAFFLLLLFNWLLKSIGAFTSQFSGTITWEGIIVKTTSDSWQLSQVLWIYLFPYSGFVFAYFIVSHRRMLFLKRYISVNLLYAWLYALLMISVYFIPLCEIINHTGIYYVLSWLYISRSEQYLLGIILMILFLYRVLRISPVFSSALDVNSKVLLIPMIILKQIPFLLYIPFLILCMLLIISSTDFSFQQNCLLIGLLFTIIVNTSLMLSYKVII